jgi:hypothetical protein
MYFAGYCHWSAIGQLSPSGRGEEFGADVEIMFNVFDFGRFFSTTRCDM